MQHQQQQSHQNNHGAGAHGGAAAGSGHAHHSHDNDEDEENRVVETDPSGRFERYSKSLGKGAYKEVFLAFDEEEGVEVAWNQLRVDHLRKQEAQRVLSEIKILQSLRNDNIINLYHAWASPAVGHDRSERVCFITELMMSGTLKSYLRKSKGPVRPRVLKSWCRQILLGLHYLHTREPPIIHRDIKCENIFINGNNGQAKIGDLGLAIAKSKDHASSVLGTPEFMAPEFYDEKYDEKVDIYAFGMVVIEIVTKEYPYSECTNQAQIYKKVSNGVKPQAIAKITDDETRSFIEHCIEFDPRLRPSATELLQHPYLRVTDAPSVSQESLSGRTSTTTPPEMSNSMTSNSGNTPIIGAPEMMTAEPGKFVVYPYNHVSQQQQQQQQPQQQHYQQQQAQAQQNHNPSVSISGSHTLFTEIGSDRDSVTSASSTFSPTPTSGLDPSQQLPATVTIEAIERQSDSIVVLRMVYTPVPGSGAPSREIRFPFNLPDDTVTDVVSEMVKESLVEARDEQLVRRRLEERVRGIFMLERGNNSQSAGANAEDRRGSVTQSSPVFNNATPVPFSGPHGNTMPRVRQPSEEPAIVPIQNPTKHASLPRSTQAPPNYQTLAPGPTVQRSHSNVSLSSMGSSTMGEPMQTLPPRDYVPAQPQHYQQQQQPMQVNGSPTLQPRAPAATVSTGQPGSPQQHHRTAAAAPGPGSPQQQHHRIASPPTSAGVAPSALALPRSYSPPTVGPSGAGAQPTKDEEIRRRLQEMSEKQVNSLGGVVRPMGPLPPGMAGVIVGSGVGEGHKGGMGRGEAVDENVLFLMRVDDEVPIVDVNDVMINICRQLDPRRRGDRYALYNCLLASRRFFALAAKRLWSFKVLNTNINDSQKVNFLLEHALGSQPQTTSENGDRSNMSRKHLRLSLYLSSIRKIKYGTFCRDVNNARLAPHFLLPWLTKLDWVDMTKAPAEWIQALLGWLSEPVRRPRHLSLSTSAGEEGRKLMALASHSLRSVELTANLKTDNDELAANMINKLTARGENGPVCALTFNDIRGSVVYEAITRCLVAHGASLRLLSINFREGFVTNFSYLMTERVVRSVTGLTHLRMGVGDQHTGELASALLMACKTTLVDVKLHIGMLVILDSLPMSELNVLKSLELQFDAGAVLTKDIRGGWLESLTSITSLTVFARYFVVDGLVALMEIVNAMTALRELAVCLPEANDRGITRKHLTKLGVPERVRLPLRLSRFRKVHLHWDLSLKCDTSLHIIDLDAILSKGMSFLEEIVVYVNVGQGEPGNHDEALFQELGKALVDEERTLALTYARVWVDANDWCFRFEWRGIDNYLSSKRNKKRFW
ncbi:Serine/threonine-protein kinase wnk1 [Irineochytrium annulatum]|nr:Serine/threonine-protein kinase wnk1 [Irineochytrium annulatum]